MISLEAYRAQVAERVARTPEQIAALDRTLRGLALVEMVSKFLSGREVAGQQAWAGAYYDPKDRAITIVDRGGPMDSLAQNALLVHELVHALQDERPGGLAEFDGRSSRTLDGRLAARAVLEGEASLVEDLAAIGGFGVSQADIPWSRVFRAAKSSARVDMVLSRAAFLLADYFFTYPFGTNLVHQAWSSEGWPAVDALFASAPASSRQVVAGHRSGEPAGGPWTETLEHQSIPVLPSGFDLLMADRLGSFLLATYLDRLTLAFDETVIRLSAEVWRASGRLRGDVLSIHDVQATATTIAAWRLRFDGPDAVADVRSIVASNLPPLVTVWTEGNDVILMATNREEAMSLLTPGLSWRALPPPPVPPPASPSPWSAGAIGCRSRSPWAAGVR